MYVRYLCNTWRVGRPPIGSTPHPSSNPGSSPPARSLGHVRLTPYQKIPNFKFKIKKEKTELERNGEIGTIMFLFFFLLRRKTVKKKTWEIEKLEKLEIPFSVFYFNLSWPSKPSAFYYLIRFLFFFIFFIFLFFYFYDCHFILLGLIYFFLIWATHLSKCFCTSLISVFSMWPFRCCWY